MVDMKIHYVFRVSVILCILFGFPHIMFSANWTLIEFIGEINQVEIGQLADPFDDPSFQANCCVVKDENWIAQLSSLLRDKEHQNIPIPFWGVLSYQVFRDTNNSTLFIAHIINAPGSIVCIDKHSLSEEQLFDTITISCPEYCRLILEKMRNSCPEQLEKMEHFYGRIKEFQGNSMEELILAPFSNR